MRAFLRKRGHALVPVDDRGHALLSSLRGADEVLVEVTQAKNMRHVKLYFAILDFCRDHAMNPETGEMLFATSEQVKTSIKVAAGAVRPFPDPITGKTFWEFRSIRDMDATEFTDFFDRAVYVITERWMAPGTAPDDVRRELMAMIEPVRVAA